VSNPHNPVMPARRQARRLRIVGVSLLLLGGSIAGLVYWLGMRSAEPMDDLGMQGFNRAEQLQMKQLFGGVGSLIEDWSNDLKQPGTQALLIMITTVAITVGCFYFAHRLGSHTEIANGNNCRPPT
jgi:hypothetical protein